MEGLEERRLLADVTFAQPFFIASTLTAAATITLDFDSTYYGETPKVELTTTDGTAHAGVDYQSVDQAVTFPPDESRTTVSIPLLGGASTGPDKTVEKHKKDFDNWLNSFK